MKRRSGPGAAVLDSVDSAAQFIDSHNITVVGFFDVRLSILSVLTNKSHLYIYIHIYILIYIYIRIWKVRRPRRSKNLLWM